MFAPKTTLRLGMLAMLVCAVSILVAGCSPDEPSAELWIIGVDGADWDQLDPMIARGELPNIARLKAEGASGILLSDTPMISPILWTSIATGKTPDLHGVTWFMTDAPDGSKIPISSEERRTRAFWNIASEAGMSCGITGWWATWPAEPIDGYLVSDAVAWHSFGVTGRSNPAEGKTWPWELIGRVEDVMPDPASVSDELMTRLIHLPADKLRMKPSASVYDDPISHLRQAIATTRGYTDLTLAMLEEERPRVMSVYYEGTDAVTHLFSRYEEPRLSWISTADHAAYKDVVAEYWKWQDEIIGELLAERGPQTTVMLISDHGFRKGAERRKEDEFHVETADEDHMPDGVIIISGPGIDAGTRLEGADIYDVTPTVLYALDLPVARDMTGHPLTEAFTAETRRARPTRWVATYETGERRRASGTLAGGEAGEDLEKMLRSLGYIGGPTGGDAGGDPSGTDDGITAEQTVNLATVLMGQGRAAEAVAKLQKVLAENPGSFEIRLNLAQALYRDGQAAASAEIFRGLIEEYPDRLEVHEDFATALRLSGQWPQALDIYERGLAVQEDWIAGLAGKGLCLARLDRAAEGLDVLKKACRLDPTSHDAFLALGLVQQIQGDLRAAAGSFGHALQLESTDPQAAVGLAESRSALGDVGGAIQVLQTTLDKGGDRAPLLKAMGPLQLQAGDTAGALETLREATRLDRDDPQLMGNLGMAYAMSGALEPAIETFSELTRAQPDMAAAHAQLGALHAQNRQMKQAEKSLRRAVELEPDNPGFRLNLAYALQSIGKLEGAADQFEEVTEMEPRNARAHYGLGRVELQLGHEEKGRRLIREARKLDPSLPVVP